jgi:hypothetical protein
MDAALARIEATTLSEYTRYKPADRRVDEKEGARDGQREKPSSDAERYPFRERIVAAAQAALRRYHHQIENLCDVLAKREQELQLDLDQRYATKRDQLNASFQNKADQIEQTIGPSSSRHVSLREAFQRAWDRERQIEADVGRPLRVHLVYSYTAIMAVVALIEIPVNRFAFELYFAETPALSLMIAFGIGLALMILAHFAGTWLKRGFGASTTGQKFAYGIGVAVTAALALPTIYLIALLRQHYVHFVEAQNVSFSELLEQRGFEDVAQEVIATDLGTSGFMLFMVNLLVVGIGVIVAVARHDAHPDYEKAVRTRERAEKRYHRIQARYDRQISRAKTEYDAQLSALEKQQDRLEREIEEIRSRQRACSAHREQMLERVSLHLKQRLQAYEEGNERTRRSEAPAFFGMHDEQMLRKELGEALAQSDVSASPGYGIRAVK